MRRCNLETAASYFDDEERKARADVAAIFPLVGAFARLNFPKAA
jgi:hypothetical protein